MCPLSQGQTTPGWGVSPAGKLQSRQQVTHPPSSPGLWGCRWLVMLCDDHGHSHTWTPGPVSLHSRALGRLPAPEPWESHPPARGGFPRRARGSTGPAVFTSLGAPVTGAGLHPGVTGPQEPCSQSACSCHPHPPSAAPAQVRPLALCEAPVCKQFGSRAPHPVVSCPMTL